MEERKQIDQKEAYRITLASILARIKNRVYQGGYCLGLLMLSKEHALHLKSEGFVVHIDESNKALITGFYPITVSWFPDKDTVILPVPLEKAFYPPRLEKGIGEGFYKILETPQEPSITLQEIYRELKIIRKDRGVKNWTLNQDIPRAVENQLLSAGYSVRITYNPDKVVISW